MEELIFCVGNMVVNGIEGFVFIMEMIGIMGIQQVM